MPSRCDTCGRPFDKWRRLRGNKVPDHGGRAENLACTRQFDEMVSSVRAKTKPIKANDGRLR